MKKFVTRSEPPLIFFVICNVLFFLFVSLGTSKKYHEHIRRTALGKITDDTKKEKRDNLRKERVCDSERNYCTSIKAKDQDQARSRVHE